mgnify:FL=1
MESLRKEFYNILEEYGHGVLLLRQKRQVRCSCFDEKTQSADRECPFCFGLGWVPVIERHTVREQESVIPETLPMIAQQKGFGEMAVGARAYYFLPDVELEQNDLIMDVGWYKDIPVMKEGKIWEVSYVDVFRFENGEAIFKKVYVKSEPVEMEVRGFNILKKDGVMSYEIRGGAQ